MLKYLAIRPSECRVAACNPTQKEVCFEARCDVVLLIKWLCDMVTLSVGLDTLAFVLEGVSAPGPLRNQSDD